MEEASLRGAVLAVVDERYMGKSYGMELYRTTDVLKALQKAAELFLRDFKGKILGITGSVGKTTIKEFAYGLLKNGFSVEKTPKSFNSQRGLPVSVLNFDKNLDMAVLEMGMSLKGEMQRLADMVRPDIALINRVGLVHSMNFKGLEEIAEEKMKIFTDETKIRIVHHSLLKFIEKKEGFITYSLENERADYFLWQKDGSIFIRDKESETEIFPSFIESHLLEDLLAAWVLAKNSGLEEKEAEKGVKQLKAVSMRFERQEINGVLFIKDFYNANSLSMAAALDNLPEAKGKKIAVLGTMGELGCFSKKAHADIGKKASKKVDILLCFGEECKPMVDGFKNKDKVFWFDDMRKLSTKLLEIKKKGDLVLVKGSRFCRMEKIFDFLSF